MEKIYHVDLTPKQRKYLQKIVRVGTNKAKVISRAHILLKSNEGKTDKEIADLLYIDGDYSGTEPVQ
jgi:DNA-binding CsgD family transcriptional regulator